jgi:hypothetical protein
MQVNIPQNQFLQITHFPVLSLLYYLAFVQEETYPNIVCVEASNVFCSWLVQFVFFLPFALSIEVNEHVIYIFIL